MYPQWFKVACNQSLAVDIICVRAAVTQDVLPSNSFLSNRSSCRNNYFPFHDFCFLFSDKVTDSTERAEYSTEVDTLFVAIYLETVTKVNFAQHLVCFTHLGKQFGKHQQRCFWFDLLKGTIENATSFVMKQHNLTLYLIKQATIGSPFGMLEHSVQVYKCYSGQHISVSRLFNLVDDCEGGDDEFGWACKLNGQTTQASNCKTSCAKANCSCTELFYHHFQGGCMPYRQKFSCVAAKCFSSTNSNKSNSEPKFIHTGIKETQTASRNSAEGADCTQTELNAPVKYNSTKCKNHTEIQCTSGCSRCFPIHKLCVYELDANHSLMHCPSGAHLKNCQHLECNNKFQCPMFYCVPYR